MILKLKTDIEHYLEYVEDVVVFAHFSNDKNCRQVRAGGAVKIMRWDLSTRWTIMMQISGHGGCAVLCEPEAKGDYPATEVLGDRC